MVSVLIRGDRDRNNAQGKKGLQSTKGRGDKGGVSSKASKRASHGDLDFILPAS